MTDLRAIPRRFVANEEDGAEAGEKSITSLHSTLAAFASSGPVS
jgi:hypothetical protein